MFMEDSKAHSIMSHLVGLNKRYYVVWILSLKATDLYTCVLLTVYFFHLGHFAVLEVDLSPLGGSIPLLPDDQQVLSP